jgi:parallel beta-helix repeat protein
VPRAAADVIPWAVSFSRSIDAIYSTLAARILSEITQGTLAQRPAANGTQRFYFSTDAPGTLYYDVGAWVVVSGTGSLPPATDSVDGFLTAVDHANLLFRDGSRALTSDWDAGAARYIHSKNSISQGTLAGRPGATGSQHFYFATDNGLLYYDSGSWVVVGPAALPPATDSVDGFLTAVDHANLLFKDGSRALTALWNAGNFRIDSRNSTRVFNVRAYGALGDGNADDTAAFQAAADAANTAGPGGVIYVPAANAGHAYMIAVASAGGPQTPGLKLYSGQRLTGEGPQSLLRAIPGASGDQIYDLITNKNSAYGSTGAAPSVVDSQIIVDNIGLDGNKGAHVAPASNSDGSAHGIYFNRVKDCLIFNVYAVGLYSDSYVYEYSSSSAIVSSFSENARKACYYLSGCESMAVVNNTSLNDGQGILVASTWFSAVVGNTIAGFGSFGVGPGVGLTQDSRYNTISGNTISNSLNINQGIGLFCRASQAGGPTIHGITYGDSSHAYGASFNTISGNTITKCNVGIYLTVQSAVSIPANFPISDNNLITGNTISEGSNPGVLLEGVQNNVVEANTIVNNSVHGVKVASFASPARNATGNKILNNDLGDYLIQEPGSTAKTHNAQTQTTPFAETVTGSNQNIFFGNTYNQTFNPAANIIGPESKVYAPYARARNSNATIAIAPGGTAIPFNIEDFDNDAIHDNSTNNTRLTCKTQGLYRITCSVEWEAGTNNTRRDLNMRANGTPILAVERKMAITGYTIRHTVTATYPLVAGDYVEVVALTDEAGNVNIKGNLLYSPVFTMERVGP